MPLAAALLAMLLACGASSGEESVEPMGCAFDAECADGEQCIDAACVAPSVPLSMSVGSFACSVVDCPLSQPSCCTAAAATASGNESQGYASRNQMVVSAQSLQGEVRADFSFDAADQQGWVTFELGAELELDRLEFTGRREGVADWFLSVNVNRTRESGCAFGFGLEPRGPSGDAQLFGNTVSLDDDEFCYGGGFPGRASQLAFAIFSVQPGNASLVISNITLHE